MTINTTDNIAAKLVVLQVLPALISGGVEREVMDIAEGLVLNGYKSLVASSGGVLVSSLCQQGSQHFTLPLNSKNPLVIISNIFRLAKIVKENKVDIIHAQSRAPAWSAYFASKISKCHFITTIHGAHSIDNLFKRIYNSIMCKGEKIICVSEFIALYAKENYKFNHNNLEVIHCGTNIKKFDYEAVDKQRIANLACRLRLNTDKPIITLPGRLTRGKGHLLLLEAIKKLPLHSVTCLFVGDDTGHLKYREELQDKIYQYNLQDDVIITSNVNDMPAIYALSDIVTCISTKPESFGLISIEAQAMGRMVIVSNLGGIRETIIDKKTGWIIEPGNVEELVKVISEIIKMNVKERIEIANSAKKHIESKFSLEKMNKSIIRIYNSIL